VQKHPRPDDNALLGGITPENFLASYWQRRWRLMRQAINPIANPLNAQAILRLAARDDVQSRLIVREGSRFMLEHGPFTPRRIRALPPTRWTMLVQGANLHWRSADDLLRRFAFIPYARLDDVMVSYAVPGGGVGPHFDSYDVFLLQAMGRRRWRLSAQRDLELRPRSPLRILRRFHARISRVLEPGDMLYLPPAVAHDGVALDECVTYSIGFRSPRALDIAREFLIYIGDRLDMPQRFRDAGRRATRHPGELPADLLRWAAGILRDVRWNRDDVGRFLGVHLSEPAATTFFDPPEPAISRAAFRRAAQAGVCLDPRSLMLYRGRFFFINGEELRAGATRDLAVLSALADQREWRGAISNHLVDIFYEHYRRGALHMLTAGRITARWAHRAAA
jgi:50S ribosomal protein L16 3-hydroxylase